MENNKELMKAEKANVIPHYAGLLLIQSQRRCKQNVWFPTVSPEIETPNSVIPGLTRNLLMLINSTEEKRTNINRPRLGGRGDAKVMALGDAGSSLLPWTGEGGAEHRMRVKTNAPLTRISGFRNAQAEILPSTLGCASDYSITPFASSRVLLASHLGRGKRAAFTLAEVLITLGIIGVVAAMTLPTLIGIGKQHAWEKQKLVFEQKFREATAQMKVADNLSGHATTEAFVAELSKYMKLAKKCDNSNIQNCYAPKIILGAEDEAEVDTLTTSASLGRNTYNTNTMGIVVLDGVSAILAYDPKCEPIDPTDNTKDTLACLSIVYDVNGRNTPNKIGMDIVTLNAAITTCDLKIGTLCTTGGDTPFAPITKDNPIYKPCISGGTDPCASSGNYWQGAGEACKALGMRLPTMDELAKIASDQYGTTIAAMQDKSGLTIDPKSKANLSGWYWSAQEINSYTSYYRSFTTTSSYRYTTKDNSGGKARCVK